MNNPEYKDEVLDVGEWRGNSHFSAKETAIEKGYKFYRFTDYPNKRLVFATNGPSYYSVADYSSLPTRPETKMKKTLPEFLDAVVAYAVEGNRSVYLEGLRQKGLFKAASYDEAVKIFEDYISDTRVVCSEGATRARKALGLAKTELKRVEREVTIVQLANLIEDPRVKVWVGSKKILSVPTSVNHNWVKDAPSSMREDTKVKVWVEEEVEV